MDSRSDRDLMSQCKNFASIRLSLDRLRWQPFRDKLSIAMISKLGWLFLRNSIILLPTKPIPPVIRTFISDNNLIEEVNGQSYLTYSFQKFIFFCGPISRFDSREDFLMMNHNVYQVVVSELNDNQINTQTMKVS